jgi:hypothetical protein
MSPEEKEAQLPRRTPGDVLTKHDGYVWHM